MAGDAEPNLRMSESSQFDPLTQALSGATSIEASAGTGKTYSITLLWLRLLVEQQLQPEQGDGIGLARARAGFDGGGSGKLLKERVELGRRVHGEVSISGACHASISHITRQASGVPAHGSQSGKPSGLQSNGLSQPLKSMRVAGRSLSVSPEWS